MISVALLSHRFGNIGHNFMALGAEAVAREAFGSDVAISHFEQHHPFTIYPEGHYLRLVDRIPHGRLGFVRTYLAKQAVFERYWQSVRPLNFDLAVACGGPNLVSQASLSAEMRIMMLHLNGAFAYQGVPLYDAAVGSGFPLERVPTELQPTDQEFYRQAFSYVSEVSVREYTAQRLYKTIGVDTEVIPCIAVGSGRYFETFRDDEKNRGVAQPIVINFQAQGSNTDWGQGVDATRWMSLVKGVIDHFKFSGERIVMLCHSAYELKLARKIAPELEAHFPSTEEEYGKVIANAKVGFVSRIHAAIALAGIGVPSLVVGNDTRIGTTEQFGLPSIFTKELSLQLAIDHIRSLMNKRNEEHDRLLQLREQTIARYSQKFLLHSVRKP